MAVERLIQAIFITILVLAHLSICAGATTAVSDGSDYFKQMIAAQPD